MTNSHNIISPNIVLPNIVSPNIVSPNIIFICTGNVFRSFSAERALRKILPNHCIASRGLQPAISPHPYILSCMQKHGLDCSGHVPTKFTPQDNQTIYICMSQQHQNALLKQNIKSTLFQKLVINQELSILDTNEALVNYTSRKHEANNIIEATISYITSGVVLIANKFKNQELIL